MNDGALNVSLAADPNDIEDAVGNDLQPLTWSYQAAIPPVIASRSPALGSMVATSGFDLDVTFSEAVQGVEAADLVLTGTAASGTMVGTPTNPSGNTWRFPVAGLATGLLSLSLAPLPTAGDCSTGETR